ncbi:DsbA family protein [Spirosoma arcticum]
MNPVQIDLISYLVCPWCYIGRKRLARAIAQLPDLETRIRCQPFELFPRIPVSGVERQSHLREVFGSAQRRNAIFAQVAEAGRTGRRARSAATLPV